MKIRGQELFLPKISINIYVIVSLFLFNLFNLFLKGEKTGEEQQEEICFPEIYNIPNSFPFRMKIQFLLLYICNH